MTTVKSAENGARKIPQFIKYRLTDDELDEAREIVLDTEDVFNFIVDVVTQNYKFSASYDSYGGGVQCFLTPGDPENENYGYTLSARAPDLMNAINMLRFKHNNLFSGIWPKETDKPTGNAWG